MPKKKEKTLLDLLIRTEGEREPAELDLPKASPPSKKPAPLSRALHTPAMHLESLRIENLWCYAHAEIDFEAGVTVIAGPNGSGKSSLLESIFFALYGSKAGPAMDRSLADVLRIGADAGSVQLRFSYGAQGYVAQMSLRRRGEAVVSEKEDCRLTREDGEEWIGVENVAQAIEGFFAMNRDDFTNCVYVRQGEIDRLIRASEEERRRMIDRLLRLEKLDRYAKRAQEGARRALNRRRDDLGGRASTLKRQIEELEEKHLERSRGDLEERRRAKQAELEEIEKKISQAEELQHGVKEKLQRLEEQTHEIQERMEEFTQKQKQLQVAEKKAQQSNQDLESLKQEYKQLENQLVQGLAQLGLAKESVIQSFNRASNWEELEILPQEFARTKDRQETLHAQIQERQRYLHQQVETLSQEKESLLKSIVQAQTQERNLRRELEEMKLLIQQGKCPTCKQPIHEGTYSTTLKQKEESLQKLNPEVEVQRKKLQTLEVQISSLKREEDKAIQQLNEEFKMLENRRTQLEELKEQTLRLLQIKDQGLKRKEDRQTLLDSMESLRDEMARIQTKLADLKRNLFDVSQLQKKSQQVQAVLQQFKERKEKFDQEIAGLHQERGRIDTQLEQLKRHREELAQNDAELTTIERLQAELEELTEFYGALKRELRTRNIRALELYFNQFFQLMAPGASYRSVHVSEDYDVTVECKDGRTIRPDLLSGGERAFTNIALRSAIHQVLAKASIRMPLILDEPTTYLDRERVKRLQFLLAELGGRIGQVIVVSHELGLVEGADHEYRTEKTADNTSRVYRLR